MTKTADREVQGVTKALNIAVTPVTYADPAEAFQAALDSGRSRPAIAENELGEFVLCCRTTARKNGWKFLGRVYGNPQVARKAMEAIEADPPKTAVLDATIETLSGKKSPKTKAAQAMREIAAALAH